MDGGDILQGSPVMYYYNLATSSGKCLVAEIMNYMAYNAGTLGNHDIKTGHAVYDRWTDACRFSVLEANVTDWAKLPAPYCVLGRCSTKIAILKIITPAVPNWIPPTLWESLEFEEMVSCARRWVPLIREREKPDVFVGLFHSSGKEGGIVTPDYAENAALDVANEMAGFDCAMAMVT